MKQAPLPASVRDLPIADVIDDVVNALRRSNVLLQAEPGAGKSTGLPLALLPHAAPDKKIVMLEPRRIAASAVAERLASQLNETVGQRVGLRMRTDTKVSKHTVLEVVTEGVLTRLLQSDPELTGYAVVIFDEFHERSLHADLGLALCLEVQNSLRGDLRLLFMSATLESDELEHHLEANRHPHLQPLQSIQSDGRQYPVLVQWLGNAVVSPGSSARAQLPQRLVTVIKKALVEEPGDVLVFLPGVAEIDRTSKLLQPQLERLSEQLDTHVPIKVLALHSRVGREVQKLATAAASAEVRRVILSTSIAETSITIDGVRVVIDSGLERRGRLDHTTGAMRLETVSANQASATQRAGRAGRTESGVCYRLWSEADHARRATSWQAEIQRAELSSLLLELIVWGVTEANELPWLEVPPAASVNQAKSLLNNLGLLNQAQLTPLGEVVSKLPVHPRIGAMLIWAQERHATELACQLAALLEEGGSTHNINLASVISNPAPRQQKNRCAQLQKTMAQLRTSTRVTRDANELPGHDSPAVDLSVLVACAYPDWIARRRQSQKIGSDATYTLACGAGAVLSEQEPLAHQSWLAVASMGGAAKDARIFQAIELDISELRAHLPHLFSQYKRCDWDDTLERVVAEQQVLLGGLVVESKPLTDLSDEERQRALLAGIRKKGMQCLPWTDECRQWQARVQLMQSLPTTTSHYSWPCVDDESLLDSLETWLPVWLNRISSIKGLSQLKLLEVLNASLDYRQQQALNALLPVRYEVPSGSSIKLRYTDKEAVLSVKLQEMFGCTTNPSIANGALNLKIELLSPAKRPVQITSDLANFWVNSYPAVKKDLAGRYPKHPWPDDPVNALPSARAKPRKK